MDHRDHAARGDERIVAEARQEPSFLERFHELSRSSSAEVDRDVDVLRRARKSMKVRRLGAEHVPAELEPLRDVSQCDERGLEAGAWLRLSRSARRPSWQGWPRRARAF